MWFSVLENSDRPNPIPIEWATENEQRLAEQGWGDFTIVLIDGLCDKGLGQAVGSTLIGFYAHDIDRVKFDATTWHEAGHNLQHRYGMKDYPRPPIQQSFMQGTNLAEISAEDFRQTFAPGDAAKISHKYATIGYGLGYELPQVIQDMDPYWRQKRAAVKKWWMINCHRDFVQAQKNILQLTYEGIKKLLGLLK